jgi:hypothetical protein
MTRQPRLLVSALRALFCAWFVVIASSALADDGPAIGNAAFDPGSKVITITGTKPALGNKTPKVTFNGVAVPATYHAIPGKVLATLGAAPEPGTYQLSVGSGEDDGTTFEVTIGAIGAPGPKGVAAGRAFRATGD